MALSSLRSYRESLLKLSKECFEEQKETIELFEEFLNNNTDAFERSNKKGHITASGFVLSTIGHSFDDLSCKTQKMASLGGHADGHRIAHEVAYKECEEESGLTSLSFFSHDVEGSYPLILDLDRHIIPARKNEEEHFHYDIRYLLLADKEEPFKITEESLDLKWIPLHEVALHNQELSILRPVRKIQALLELEAVKLS